MARLEHPRGRLELDLDLGRHAGLEPDRCGVPVAVREVEDRPARQGGGSVGEDVTEADRQVRDGYGRGERQLHARMAHHVQVGLGEIPVEDERERVVEPLISGQSPGPATRAGDPRGAPDVTPDVNRLAALAVGAEDVLDEPFGWPGRLAAPLAPHLGEIRGRPRRAAGEDGDRRLRVDAVLLVGEPAAEPADQLRHEVDVRPGSRGCSRAMAPGAEDDALRAGERLEAAEGDVRVPVGPAGDDHRRAGDPVVPGPHRAVAPVGPVGLLHEPAQQPRLDLVDPPRPFLAPALAEDGGHGREGIARDHVGRPVDQVERLHRSAHVVDVVGVAVVRGVDRRDRTERGRAQAGDLQRVEARPRGAVHADAPVRPLLRGEPGDHLADVVELLGGVLVGGKAARGAGAADVEPADGEPALPAEPLVLGAVGGREVVHPVGQRLEDDRRRLHVRQPQLRGKAGAVGDGDEDVAVLHGRNPPR